DAPAGRGPGAGARLPSLAPAARLRVPLERVGNKRNDALSTGERPQVGTELDEVQRRLKIVLRYCLYALILLVTGFAVVLFRAFAHDASRAFLNLYGGVAYLAFLAWAVGKPRALRPRPSDPPPSDLPDV